MFKTLWVTTLLAAVLAFAAAALFATATAPNHVAQQPMQETSTYYTVQESTDTQDIGMTSETERMLTCPDHQLEGRYPEVSACPHFPILCHGGCKQAGFDSGTCSGEVCRCVNFSQLS